MTTCIEHPTWDLPECVPPTSTTTSSSTTTTTTMVPTTTTTVMATTTTAPAATTTTMVSTPGATLPGTGPSDFESVWATPLIVLAVLMVAIGALMVLRNRWAP